MPPWAVGDSRQLADRNHPPAGPFCPYISRENIMADDNGGGGNVLLSFLLGGVLVAVAVVGFFMWDNYKSHSGGGAPTATITVKKS